MRKLLVLLTSLLFIGLTASCCTSNTDVKKPKLMDGKTTEQELANAAKEKACMDIQECFVGAVKVTKTKETNSYMFFKVYCEVNSNVTSTTTYVCLKNKRPFTCRRWAPGR